jgi:uncharacterized coiled-coil protein SlyX
MEIETKIAELEDKISAQAEYIQRLENQIQWLTEQMKLAKKRQFGASSEQTTDGQLCIFNEAEQNAVPDAPEPEISEKNSSSSVKCVSDVPRKRCRCPSPAISPVDGK